MYFMVVLLRGGNGIATIVLTKDDAGWVVEGADCRAAGEDERDQPPHRTAEANQFVFTYAPAPTQLQLNSFTVIWIAV